MSPRVAFVSFRFGQTDGVSVVTRTWIDAFSELGFEAVTVSGDPASDRVVQGLNFDIGDAGSAELDETAPSSGIDSSDPTSLFDIPADRNLVSRVAAALGDADLVVVENLLTIPLNLGASRAVASALTNRPALIHHHDPPWHRDRFAHITSLPVDDSNWRHVTINQRLRQEFAARGIESTVIYNSFAPPVRRTEAELANLRHETRCSLGIEADELVIAHPVRAIERKNIPAALDLAESLGATYWLLGPAEECYGATLKRLLAGARCRVIHREWTETDAIYAAADHIAFPSTWEGFGNPPLEAALRRRTVTVGRYPVSDELRALGFQWFETGDTDGPAAAIRDSESPAVRAMLDRNELIALEQFSLERMRESLRELLDEAGWLK